jgi:hypothetical protein
MPEIDEMDCGEFAEVAAELALGVLTGRERAAALAHLDGCESCREQVRELTMTGEELLGLLPSREPPAGFESRVLDRLGLSAPRHQPGGPRRPGRRTDHRTGRPASLRPDAKAGRPRGRLSRVMAVAAVVAALAGAGLGGWGLRAATAPSVASSAAQSSPLSTAALVASSGNRTVGQVFVYKHVPWWMYMSVAMDGFGNATVRCQLETADGHYTTVGEFRLYDGYGSWGSPYSVGSSAVVGARLLSANGTVLAAATFPNGGG